MPKIDLESKLRGLDIDALVRELHFVPYGGRIIIKELEVTQIGSIYIANPQAEEMRTNEGVVLAVGPGVVKGSDGTPIVTIGDCVYFGKHAGFIFKRGAEEFRCINDKDLIALNTNPPWAQKEKGA